MSAASCSGDLCRGKIATTTRADDEQALEDVLDEVQVRQAARVVLPPVPERPRRVATDLPADRPVPEDAQLVQRARLEQDDRERGESRAPANPATNRPETRRSGIGEPERRDEERRELRQPGKRGERAAADGRGDEPEPPDEKARHAIASFVFEFDAYCVNGYAAHANASIAPSLAAAETPADEPQAEHAEDVEGDRSEVRSRQGVPLAAPAEQRDSPGCTTRRRPARTCRPAGSRTRSARSSGCGRGSRPTRRPARTP